MPTLVLFHEFGKFLGDGTIDLDTHAFKAALSNAAPTQATNTVLADITQISAGFGYATGGVAITCTWTETGAGTGIWRFDSGDIAWTASGGAIAAHRYLVIYDDTAAADQLVGYVDRGSSADIPDGSTRTWTTANGLFDLTVP